LARRTQESPDVAPPARLLSVEDLSDLIQIPVETIYRWRHRGEGPKGLKVGKHVRFDPAEVGRWLREREGA
jgi:excisionase family DNA binding protein